MPLSSLVVMNAETPLALHLHRPAGDPAEPLPAVIVTGSWLTVKEQLADRYAAELARRGYAAFTFDFSGFGASGGSVRQTEMPTRKIADLQAVVRFVASRSTVAPGGPGVLAVCASAQYTLAALAAGTPIATAMPGRPALVWGDGEQTDFYDRPAAVDFALDAADEHFRRTLGAAG
jgi:uncharacterized protein